MSRSIALLSRGSSAMLSSKRRCDAVPFWIRESSKCSSSEWAYKPILCKFSTSYGVNDHESFVEYINIKVFVHMILCDFE